MTPSSPSTRTTTTQRASSARTPQTVPGPSSYRIGRSVRKTAYARMTAPKAMMRVSPSATSAEASAKPTASAPHRMAMTGGVSAATRRSGSRRRSRPHDARAPKAHVLDASTSGGAAVSGVSEVALSSSGTVGSERSWRARNAIFTLPSRPWLWPWLSAPWLSASELGLWLSTIGDPGREVAVSG